MSNFKLSEDGINSVTILKASDVSASFKFLLKELETHLDNLDKLNRNVTDPNILLKNSGKAQMLDSILSSIASA